jgi:hypothetical protein
VITVVEVEPFLRLAGRIWTDEEILELKVHLAHHPYEGVIIPGTGGVRKLRWKVQGSGKRGGARVVYYYHSDQMPLFLLTVYAKSTAADLSQAERNALATLVPRLIAQYRR